ncbi:PREDICTED: uncharacterized protein LOC106819405 [Priapulus caudatus]|uniref:Uncharacterized protein LOC106819405 n=1 Tax=Priapulus caudatus TaxID=37621 RepID=A0ABM1F512_PRICU|nr:PREDICTED: uncharacterized protein LOC106819405 [Priapulus caudatus]
MVDDDDTMAKTKCIHPSCKEMFYHKTKMLQHLEEEHGVGCEKSAHNFKTFAEFLEWKEKEEITNFVYFSKQKGVSVGKNTEYSYYICQLDGSEKPHRAKDEPSRKNDRRNKKGQVKDSTTCPARMLVHKSLETGEVDVNYIHTHSHVPSFHDTQHHPIPKSVQEQIKGKLALNIPVTQIIRDLRDGLGERNNRDDIVVGQLRAYQFISKRVMREMHRKMNVKARLHPHDNMFVYLRVSMLEQENFNPIVLYKPLGSEVVVGDAEIDELPHAKDLFAVGIQTREQLKMMNNREILCVDATYGTNQYKYGLLNLIVPDEFGIGYPIVHLNTSHQDEKTLYYFFLEMKKRCPDMKSAVIMSDDDYSAPNAIKAVFGEDIRHILCKWHLHRAWQRRLRQDIRDETTINEIYGCLVVILEEKSTKKFHELVLQGKVHSQI